MDGDRRLGDVGHADDLAHAGRRLHTGGAAPRANARTDRGATRSTRPGRTRGRCTARRRLARCRRIARCSGAAGGREAFDPAPSCSGGSGGAAAAGRHKGVAAVAAVGILDGEELAGVAVAAEEGARGKEPVADASRRRRVHRQGRSRGEVAARWDGVDDAVRAPRPSPRRRAHALPRRRWRGLSKPRPSATTEERSTNEPRGRPSRRRVLALGVGAIKGSSSRTRRMAFCPRGAATC